MKAFVPRSGTARNAATRFLSGVHEKRHGPSICSPLTVLAARAGVRTTCALLATKFGVNTCYAEVAEHEVAEIFLGRWIRRTIEAYVQIRRQLVHPGPGSDLDRLL